MVADPRDYPWSSHRALACGETDPLLTPHSDYLALAGSPAERQQRYRALVREPIDADTVEAIRRHLQRQHPYGPERFRCAIEAQLGRAVGPQKIRRPRKERADDADQQALRPSNLTLPGL